MGNILKYKRGSIWWHTFEYNCTDCNIMLGKHPCVIVSNDIFNMSSGSVIVVPLTSSIDKHLGKFKVEVTSLNDKPCAAVCNQIKAVDVRDIDGYSGILPDEDMVKIDNFLKYHLGFESSCDRREEVKNLDMSKTPILYKELPLVVSNPIEIYEAEDGDKTKKKNRTWTIDSKNEFLSYYAEKGTVKTMEKYDIPNKDTCYQMVHAFKRSLKLLGGVKV